MLPVTLPALLAQDYPGEFRVVLVDDRSDDGTGGIAAGLGDKVRGRRRRAAHRARRAAPAGRLGGKVWAMAQGAAAAAAEGAASTCCSPTRTSRWAPGALRDLVAAAAGDDRALVSQMALLRAETAWERVIVPAFVYFFAQLYPFRRVNEPGQRDGRRRPAGACWSAAAALEEAGGLEPDPRRADRRRGARPRC